MNENHPGDDESHLQYYLIFEMKNECGAKNLENIRYSISQMREGAVKAFFALPLQGARLA